MQATTRATICEIIMPTGRLLQPADTLQLAGSMRLPIFYSMCSIIMARLFNGNLGILQASALAAILVSLSLSLSLSPSLIFPLPVYKY